MTHRERSRTAIDRGVPDRVPKCDGYWTATLDRWREEGLPRDADPFDYFGLEWRFVFIDASLQLEEELLEQTEDYAVRRNAYGVTARYSRTREAPAHYLDFEIKTRADWERLKGRLVPNRDRASPTGFYSLVDHWTPPEPDWGKRKARIQGIVNGDNYVVVFFYGGFESVWRKIGYEQALIAMAEEPEWVRDMIETHTDMIIQTYRIMHDEGLCIDGVLPSCDIAYKTGTLFSPKMFRELELPAMKRMCEALRGLGVQSIYHGDGNVEEFIPLLIEAGIDCIQPMEVNAGMDVRDLKRKYGKNITFEGGIGTQVTLPLGTPEQVREEIRQCRLNLGPGGGFIMTTTKPLRPEVSTENAVAAVETIIEEAHKGSPR